MEYKEMRDVLWAEVQRRIKEEEVSMDDLETAARILYNTKDDEVEVISTEKRFYA